LEAVEYGLNHDKWLLLDVPGLGKTLSIQLLAEELHR
jgi:MoxR-like ATPase